MYDLLQFIFDLLLIFFSKEKKKKKIDLSTLQVCLCFLDCGCVLRTCWHGAFIFLKSSITTVTKYYCFQYFLVTAELLGFENYIPAFATAPKGFEILRGVNYASGSAGIRNESGQHLVILRSSPVWCMPNFEDSHILSLICLLRNSILSISSRLRFYFLDLTVYRLPHRLTFSRCTASCASLDS